MDEKNLPEVPLPLPEVPSPVPELLSQLDQGFALVGEVKNGHCLRPEQVPVLIAVQGRGVREPVVQVESEVDRVRARIDCAHNHEFWVELTIPTATLLELVERAAALHPTRHLAILSFMHSVKELFKK